MFKDRFTNNDVLFSMDLQVQTLVDDIFNILGPGHSERIYHNALELQLRLANIMYERERVIEIKFKNYVVGHIRADLIVNNEIVVELKVGSKIKEDHVDQCKRYMKQLNISKGMVICFPELKGVVEVVSIGC